MTDIRTEGVVTLLASLSHGGEHAGTASFLRREKIVQPDGEVVQVPVVSGNAVRGILRDFSARLTWDALGQPDLPLPIFHALWSGGTLTKTGTGIGTRQLRTLRELVPHVSLFGCSGGGRIIEGRLMVGKMMPVCAQTASVLPAELAVGPLPDLWDLLQMEEFSRMDDSRRLSNQAIGNGAPDGEPDQGALITETVNEDVKEVTQQMRYGVETICAGTRLHWWLALRGASDLEVAHMAATLGEWMSTGAHIGGRSATGHGRLALDMDRWQSTPLALTTGGPLGATAGVDRGAHYSEHREQILEALTWLV